MPDGLRQLEHEHRERPRRRERAALDRDRPAGGPRRSGGGCRGRRRSRPGCPRRWCELRVGEAHVVGDERRAGTAVAAAREPAERPAADAVARRPRPAGPRCRPPRAARGSVRAPSPTASQPAPREPGERLRASATAAAAALRGRRRRRRERLAAARVEHREHVARGPRRRAPVPRAWTRATSSAPRAWRQRARGRDADPQAREAPGPDARRRCGSTSAQLRAGLGERLLAEREQPLRVPRAARRAPGRRDARSAPSAGGEQADDRRRRRGVEREDEAHPLVAARSIVTIRRSGPSCSSRTRATTRAPRAARRRPRATRRTPRDRGRARRRAARDSPASAPARRYRSRCEIGTRPPS